MGKRDKKKLIQVDDKMQRGYRDLCVAPIGRNFAPEFQPDLTPKKKLRLGVFCGKYLHDCIGEFPKSWFHRKARGSTGLVHSISLAWTQASRCRSGARKA